MKIPTAGEPCEPLEVAHRVDRLAVHAHLEVDVGPEAVSRAADVADDAALRHGRADADADRGLVPVGGREPVSVVDDGQIAGLRTRLQLSSDQAEYWPAVEAALREVVQSQLRGRKAVHGRVNIDTNSPEVQKLIYAAMPLLMRLREDQKGEVRKLARVIGLEQVASQI